MSAKRLYAVALAVLSVAAAHPAGARADADPPSDFLFTQDVYYPYKPKLQEADARQIDTLVRRVRAKGFKLKVAIIGSLRDLGGVPQLYGHVQNYADFLHDEISFNQSQPLLVVMPQGLALSHAPAEALKGLEGLEPPGTEPRKLAATTLAAVAQTSRAAGYRVPIPKGAAGSGTRAGGRAGESGTPAVVYVVPVALLALVLLIVTVRERRGDPEEESEA
jgi:hypothetical protein